MYWREKKEGWVMPTPSKTTGYQESDEQAAAWSTRITSGTASITHQSIISILHHCNRLSTLLGNWLA